MNDPWKWNLPEDAPKPGPYKAYAKLACEVIRLAADDYQRARKAMREGKRLYIDRNYIDPKPFAESIERFFCSPLSAILTYNPDCLPYIFRKLSEREAERDLEYETKKENENASH